ncbi:MAG: 50S ribosomal protein L2 [Candidatus Kerfeldbacteria bacterium]|nr:50S ribosomal protein L2 [Candidatus Kerfeldbacteria bacterium]
MGLRIYNPTSPGRRKSSVNDYAELIGQQQPAKSLMRVKISSGGRNMAGRITVRHRGGGNKRQYRLVDFRQTRFGQPATVLGIQYDPNRSTHVALIEYPDKSQSYILAPQDMKIGQSVVSSLERVEIVVGNRTTLTNIPAGIPIHNVELRPGRGGVLVRSAGNNTTVMSIEGDYALLKMPSGEIRKVLKTNMASIGQLSNVDHGNIRWGKAGRMRWRGFRPSVRGKAMNPVDHPHGGGEGHNPIGLPYPKTPWGKHASGVKTRHQKKYSRHLIISRRPR